MEQSNPSQEIKEVPLPERVTVWVDELLKLREEAAMLAALKMANVEQWDGWRYAMHLYDNNDRISDIRLGDWSVLGHRTDRGTGSKRRKGQSINAKSDWEEGSS